MKKKIVQIAIIVSGLLSLGLFCSCDKSESYVSDEQVQTMCLTLNLNYESNEYLHDSSAAEGQDGNLGSEQCASTRFIVRAYGLDNGKRNKQHSHEFTFTESYTQPTNQNLNIELPAGDYDILIWSDIVQGDKFFYDASDFSRIKLLGDHQGNNTFRDAFYGIASVSSLNQSNDISAQSVEVAMQRPLAKFELIANDITQFRESEMERSASENMGARGLADINIDDYTVVFQYVGYMPSMFSLFTEKPVDSATGVVFTSTLTKLSDTEVSLGFDYVFVNNKDSAVTIKVAVFDKEGNLVSLTSPTRVPLKRNYHTVLCDNYLSVKTSDGIGIDTEYDGDHNVVLP